MARLAFDAVQNTAQKKLYMSLENTERLDSLLLLHQTLGEKTTWIYKDPRVLMSIRRFPAVDMIVSNGSVEERYVIGLTVLLDQFERLFDGIEKLPDPRGTLQKLVSILVDTERFYQPIGGLLGYYQETLRLIAGQKTESRPTWLPPPFFEMRAKTASVWTQCYEGICRLGEVAQVFTVGGAGDRLKLTDVLTGAPLPVARLLFLGKTLLEWLFRDVEALEYLYFRVFGRTVSVPVVLMASHERQNAEQIQQLCVEHQWFGKAPKDLCTIVQSLVPTIGLDGQWICSGPAQLVAKPGGHGVIWKLAQDAGAFDWLSSRGISTILVRQINNPFPSLDHTISSFLGAGLLEHKWFGFASCPPRPGFAEGLIALESTCDNMVGVVNIEYTLFERIRAENLALFDGTCPANINMLFANMEAVRHALQSLPIPGKMVNAKMEVDCVEDGKIVHRPVVRLESMMQGIADAMMTPLGGSIDREDLAGGLSTFLALYDRSKSFSVTKRASAPGQSLYETPESCLYDWYLISRRLLKEICYFELPPEVSLEEFFRHGPNSLFFFHPALGPLWEIIGQKVCGGRLSPGAELELEIAEVSIRNLSVKGSFRLLADSVTGCLDESGVRHLGPAVGRAVLKNVEIVNEGVSQGPLQSFVDRSIPRAASCTICLKGASELIAEDVVLRGDFSLTVQDGTRVILRQRPDGGVFIIEEPYDHPEWMYSIEWDGQSAPWLHTK